MRVPPFVLRADDGQWSGLSVDLWKRIAAELKVEFEFREFDYDPAGPSRRAGAASDRCRDRGYSGHAGRRSPGSTSRIPILPPASASRCGPNRKRGVLAMLAGFFTSRVLGTVARPDRASVGDGHADLGAGTAAGREHSSIARPVARHRRRGVVGGGDDDHHRLRRQGAASDGGEALLGVLWMFASLFLITLFSATLASSFVVDRLRTGVTGPADLPRARVATVSGTPGEQWLEWPRPARPALSVRDPGEQGAAARRCRSPDLRAADPRSHDQAIRVARAARSCRMFWRFAITRSRCRPKAR